MTTSDEQKAKRAAWREANRERLRAYDRARYPVARGKSVKRSTQWRKDNPERARAIAAKWREANRDKIRAARAARKAAGLAFDDRRRRVLGVDPAAYERLFERQGRACAICRCTVSKKWALDHDHDTGKVRGVLCNKCNLGIGLLKDDAKLLLAAVRYLELHALL